MSVAIADDRLPSVQLAPSLGSDGESNRLRIGILAAPWVPVPPTTYGGSELMIDALARGLVRAGHHVELFTTGDSECAVSRHWLFDRADPDRMGASVLELRHVAAAYDYFADSAVDLVHDHTLAGLFLNSRPLNLPVVTTCHGPFNDDLADLYRRSSADVPLISISHDQARRAPDGVEPAAVIHHGIDLDRYPYSDRPDDQFLFLGRIDHTKGVETAAILANKLGVRLIIAAKMRDSAERRYFDSHVRPHLSEHVEFVGEVDHATKVDLLRRSRALINPIRWPEPFGLVMIEALACGTPVIGRPCGASPEIIDHGETGFLAREMNGLEQAILAIDTIDRRRCREVAERRFGADRMVEDHVGFYRSVLARSTKQSLGTGSLTARSLDAYSLGS